MAYLNRALTNLRAEVDACWPNRDRSSDGWIGDEAHQGTSSDHNPDPAGQPDAGSVDAWDMDEDGVDVRHIIDRFERHEASQYWIYNREIANRNDGWTRRPYTGSNPHDKHVHFNTRESHEGSTEPWGIGDEMDPKSTHDAVWVDYPAGEYYDDDGDLIKDSSTPKDALFKAAGRAAEARDRVKDVQEQVGALDDHMGALEQRMIVLEEGMAELLRRVPDAPAG